MRGSLNKALQDESSKAGINMFPLARPFSASLAPEQPGHPITISVDHIVEVSNPNAMCKIPSQVLTMV